MRELNLIEEVRTRLVRKGFSRRYAGRATEELWDHYCELIAEVERQGKMRADAKRDAAARLGDATELADEIFERLRATSWLGRNPSISFGMLALMLTILWWGALAVPAAWACGLLVENAALRPLDGMLIAIDWIRAGSHIVPPLLCCHVAQRYFCGWKPALWACLVIAIHNGTHIAQLKPAPGATTVATWGYTFNTANGPGLLAITAPLAVFALFWIWNSRESFVHKQERVVA